MNTQYEIIKIDQAEITVDVSLLIKKEEMFFNATEMAKSFNKDVREYLRSTHAKEYINVILNEGIPHIKNYEDLVRTKKGRYGGTWLHNEVAFEFAGWCSAIFRRKLHKWYFEKLSEEQSRKRSRLEAKTGYLPMTNAILRSHNPAKPYHFSNEADLINRIVLGMPAKKFREEYEVDNVREGCTAAQLQELDRLQRINTGLIEIGMGYQERKEHLERCHRHELILLGDVA